MNTKTPPVIHIKFKCKGRDISDRVVPLGTPVPSRGDIVSPEEVDRIFRVDSRGIHYMSNGSIFVMLILTLTK